jgi:hypothetical protein
MKRAQIVRWQPWSFNRRPAKQVTNDESLDKAEQETKNVSERDAVSSGATLKAGIDFGHH